MWVHRTIIVPAPVSESARAACAGLAGPGGSGMFVTPLSQTGEAPPTHYISSGLIEAPFADLLPLTSVTYDGDGAASTDTRPGDIGLTVQLAADAGLPFTAAEVSALFAAVYVSEAPSEAVLSFLNLTIIQEV